MPLGVKALDPNTPYFVYEFVFNGKVFYVGHTYHPVRANGRWTHVKNLVRLENNGTLSRGKRADLYRKSNQVIAALIRAGLPPHQVAISWRGIGKRQADIAEEQRILKRCAEGCVLANINHTVKEASVDEILQYLGVRR